MSNSDIVEQLTALKVELEKRISAIEIDFKKGRSQDFAEQTTESENDEVLDGIHHEATVELAQINEALKRLANDQYGVCTECQNTIAPERLNALPYTHTCINCAA